MQCREACWLSMCVFIFWTRLPSWCCWELMVLTLPVSWPTLVVSCLTCSSSATTRPSVAESMTASSGIGRVSQMCFSMLDWILASWGNAGLVRFRIGRRAWIIHQPWVHLRVVLGWLLLGRHLLQGLCGCDDWAFFLCPGSFDGIILRNSHITVCHCEDPMCWMLSCLGWPKDPFPCLALRLCWTRWPLPLVEHILQAGFGCSQGKGPTL